MKRDLPGIRPPVIAHETFARLDELRTFRQLVANIYDYNLIPQRVLRFAYDLQDAHGALRDDLTRFLDALQKAAEERLRRG
ncbi:MAG: hypothetical protein HPY55_08665 [Firmicutes bacterium]|nr:hypothetical protein [Bacillota bacterium]